MKNKVLILATFFCMGLANKAVSQSLSSSKEIYLHDFFVNETVVINFSDGPGNAKDWIGIYKEDQLPDIGDYLTWLYVDGTQSGNTGKKSGVVEFDDFFVPGTYKAYLLEDNGYTILASSSFKITEEIILPENTPPSVEGQSVNVDEDGSVSITLKGEDDDGDDLGFTVVSQPKNGTLNGSAPNLTYSPKPDFNGDDSFTYKANDGEADSNTATVAIKIIKKDFEPSLTMSQPQYEHNNIFDRELIVINFSDGPGNATDWIGIYKEDQLPGIGDYLTWLYVDGTQSGNTGKKSGVVEFDDFFVPGTYKAYLLEDNGYTILASSSFKITEKVIPENTPPSVEGQSVNVDEDGSISITLKGEDDDGDDLEFTVVSQPKNGTLSGSAPNLTYSPKANFHGSDSFMFKANDGVSDSNTAAVSIKVDSVNDKPVISGQSFSVNEDETVSITLQGSDEDKDDLNFTVLNQPKNGALSGTGPNLTYTPKDNFHGSESFTFKANDGVTDSNTATVSIKVDSVNDKPVVSGQSVSIKEDETVSITLEGSDEDKDDLNFTVLSQPKNGALSGTGPSLIYTPKANYYGSDSFTFKANDGVTDSNTATVSIKVDSVNDKPVVSGQSVSIKEDETVSITLEGSDEDKDDLNFTVLSQPKNGTLSGSAPTLSYSPNENYSGSDSFSYKANDGAADSNTATVKITVNGVNDKPEVANQSVDVDEDESVSITLSGSDEEGDTLSFTVLSQSKNGTLSGSAPNLTYSPKANFNGEDSFTYKANDGEADSNTATVTINVIAGTNLKKGVYYEEDFDGLKLVPFESDSESDGDATDWASQGPSGWVMRKNNGHGITGGGDDVVEFDGWTFFDPVSWNATAGQNRSNFTKGTGVIAVADSDEYDDKDDAKLNASLSTPSIDISDASGSKLILKYDSSWRKEPQIGSVSVSYDGGGQIELLKLDGNSPDAYNDTVELELNNPTGAKSAVISWNYEGHNNWWWAIDNISVYEKIVKPALVLSKNSYDYGESIIATFLDGPGDAKNWVGIWRVEQNPMDENSLARFYVDGTKNGLVGKKSGSLNFGKELPAGEYKAVLINNDKKGKF